MAVILGVVFGGVGVVWNGWGIGGRGARGMVVGDVGGWWDDRW